MIQLLFPTAASPRFCALLNVSSFFSLKKKTLAHKRNLNLVAVDLVNKFLCYPRCIQAAIHSVTSNLAAFVTCCMPSWSSNCGRLHCVVCYHNMRSIVALVCRVHFGRPSFALCVWLVAPSCR